MISYLRQFLAFIPITILFYSCSSTPPETRTQERTESDDETDSVALIYDPKKADPRYEDFAMRLHKRSSFNGNILVAKNGKIIYEKAIGWADHLHRDSLKINSVFELASVSKPFTSVGIMMLVEDGKLRLDQNVKEFFPDFPYEGITVRMLLSHRSGMMNYVYFVDGLWKKAKRDERPGITNQDVMKLIAEHKPNPYMQPNKRFHYNNSNFMVLAAIIEKVTGKKYSQYMAENVFKPAGLKHTAVYSKAEYDKIPVDVVGHDRTWRRSVAQNFLDGPVGDKGVYSTIHDLFLFDRALRNGKLLKKASLDSMFTPRNDMQKGHFNYGYGWRLFEDGNKKVVYHTGWWHGFRHIYLRQMDEDITVILLSNLTNGSLLHLDELYNLVGMPVVRRSAYSGSGANNSDDED
ncbi:serine hydrolase domain-containing protein [Daejeonella lutea]|uniref:CubicO group peptidase, beta-lactamase class C family n=1 Tax=Daejeonella lutea TaxID=572036 RepID=A0A1T5DL28_9SPHI|nr:serine hydrolase domain-containing protein [Daejeonella lutea]SKB72366.1 CubicO group peptidase, beta-lactamase class C family [Daejeonella lutea]